MKKISSRRTFFLKKIFPLLFFGIAAINLAIPAMTGVAIPTAIFIIIPIVICTVGFIVMKTLIWDLMDEVYDCGDYLLVKRSGQEQNIYLKDIMNISSTLMMNPPRVTLRLRKDGVFGHEVTFTPITKVSFTAWRKNPIVEDLIVRVDNARMEKSAGR